MGEWIAWHFCYYYKQWLCYDFAFHQSAQHSVWTSIFIFQNSSHWYSCDIPYKHCKQHTQTTGNLSCFTLQVMLNVLEFIVRDFASSQCGFHFPCLHDGFWLITSRHGWWRQLSHAKQLNCLATSAAQGRRRDCVRECRCKRGSEKE